LKIAKVIFTTQAQLFAVCPTGTDLQSVPCKRAFAMHNQQNQIDTPATAS